MKFVSPPSRTAFAAAAVLTITHFSAQAASTPQLNYNFNGNSNNTGAYAGGLLTLSGGAVLGAAGTGLTGGSDQALDLRSAGGMGSGFTGGVASFTVGNTLTASSFTLSLWYKTDSTTALGNNARLLDTNIAPNLTVRGGGVTTSATLGQASLTGSGTGQESTANAYSATQAYVFLAVTFDATANGGAGQTSFYRGSAAGNDVTLVTQTTGNPAGGASFNLLPTGGTISLGNRLGDLARPFDGLLDDVSLYSATDGTGALSLSALQGVQNNELAVPEPSVNALASLGLGLLAVFSRFRSRVKRALMAGRA